MIEKKPGCCPGQSTTIQQVVRALHAGHGGLATLYRQAALGAKDTEEAAMFNSAALKHDSLAAQTVEGVVLPDEEEEDGTEGLLP